MDPSFFTTQGSGLVPTLYAGSSWGSDHLHGVAVSGALARQVEVARHELGRDDVGVGRFTVDLFRPVSKQPCTLEHRVVREGRRIVLVDALLLQEGEPAARASAVLLRRTETPPGRTWSSDERPEPPPLDVVAEDSEPFMPWMRSDGEWSEGFAEHQNDARKTSWSQALPVVAGEPLTPFQSLAAVCDGASMVTNWGTRGVQHINADISVSLVRLPEGLQVGLQARTRLEQDGVVSATATAFDRSGVFGSVAVSCLANARRPVDMTEQGWPDESGR